VPKVQGRLVCRISQAKGQRQKKPPFFLFIFFKPEPPILSVTFYFIIFYLRKEIKNGTGSGFSA
jgi:hypothetical protein